MHTVFALLCFVVVIHWLIFPFPSGLLHWHCGNLTIAPVPAKQPWWIWIHTSCEFIMNDCITTTKQSTTKPCAYFLGYTVYTIYIKMVIRYTLISYVRKITASRFDWKPEIGWNYQLNHCGLITHIRTGAMVVISLDGGVSPIRSQVNILSGDKLIYKLMLTCRQ